MEIIRPRPRLHDQNESVFTSLPVEIIHYQILTKVSAKSLLRFKCVSKEWHNLTKNQTFIDLHLKHAHESHESLVVSFCRTDRISGVLFFTYLDAPRALTVREVVVKREVFDIDRGDYGCRVVGSCNGLICLSIEPWPAETGVALCNPLTKECRKLGYPPSQKKSIPESWVILEAYGFGYDCVSHVYKIVKITFLYKGGKYQRGGRVHVYSTSTESWREITKKIPPCYLIFKPTGVCLNNKLHWNNSLREENCKSSSSILTFDLHTEEFGEMQLPSEVECEKIVELVVSGGLLYASHYQKMELVECLIIWVMKEYGVTKSWTKLYTIRKEHVEISDTMLFISHRSKTGGSVEALMRRRYKRDDLVWYNFEDDSTTNVDVLGNNWRYEIFDKERKIDDDGHPWRLPDDPWVCMASIAPIPSL